MTQINGITDFLTQAGTQFKVFDMGRRIEEISPQTFLAFEMGEAPYPLALQQQAWLAILVWNEQTHDNENHSSEDRDHERVTWFLRFPLDAAGKLTSGIRDDFVLRLLNREDSSSENENNPYGFKPKQEHMAWFHARASQLLGQPASSYYEHARDYFAGKPGYDQWAFVGFQGIADIVARLDESNNTELLSHSITEMPAQPFEALAQCLEHQKINHPLSQSITNILQRELNKTEPSANFISLCIRALSNTQNQALLNQHIETVLNSDVSTHPEILASISGRCWQILLNEKTIALYLEALSRCNEGQEFFNLVIVDLINIPGMQQSILKAVKSPERSERLSRSIGELFKTFT
ncbi:hypothetical protein MNBD_GAMMA11-3330 [hydrothermal vent metagenome]|uniref:DUF3549 domain-containing protein n=1 Tax=hydrothermal vent metagenome TaxID=652676 RepID=A0A3B0XDK8_9ZZZZ